MNINASFKIQNVRRPYFSQGLEKPAGWMSRILCQNQTSMSVPPMSKSNLYVRPPRKCQIKHVCPSPKKLSKLNLYVRPPRSWVTVPHLLCICAIFLFWTICLTLIISLQQRHLLEIFRWFYIIFILSHI